MTHHQEIWLDTFDAMQLLKVSRSTLLTLRKTGRLTTHRMPGCRKVYYLRSELDTLLGLHAIDEQGKIDRTAFLAVPQSTEKKPKNTKNPMNPPP